MDSINGEANRIPDVIERLHHALKELLPAMVADGGGAELVSFNEGIATFNLLGTCNFCPSRQLSAMALKRGIQERVPEVAMVNIVYPALRSGSSLDVPPPARGVLGGLASATARPIQIQVLESG